MMRIFKNIFFLLIINSILFFIIYGVNHNNKRLSEPRYDGMTGVHVDTIQAIEIKGKSIDTPYVLKKVNNQWLFEGGFEWFANPYAVNKLLACLQSLDIAAVLDVDELRKTGQSLSDYELDNPYVTIQLWDINNQSRQIMIGHSTKIGDNVYVLGYDKRSIYVVSKALLDVIMMPVDVWVKPSIFGVNLPSVQGITVKMEDPNATMIMVYEDKGWFFESPAKVLADSYAVNRLLSDLLGFRVVDFLSSQEAQRAQKALASAYMRITLVTAHGKHVLKIGRLIDADLKNEYIGCIEGMNTFFVLPGSLVDEWENAYSVLRDRHIFQIEPNTVSEIEVSMGDKVVSLQKIEEGVWNVIKKTDNGNIQTYKADIGVVSHLVEYLVDLKTESFLGRDVMEDGNDGVGLEDPQRVIKIKTANKHYELAVGALDKSTQTLFAYEKIAGVVYQVDPAVLHWASLSVLDYYDRVLYSQSEKADIKKVKVSSLKDPSIVLEYVFEEDRLASKQTAEDKNIEALLGHLKTMRVHSYLKEGFSLSGYEMDGKIIPWEWHLEETIFLPGADDGREIVRNYYFTHRLGGDLQIGGAYDEQKIFRLNQDLMDVLFALTFQREKKSVERLRNVSPSDQPAIR